MRGINAEREIAKLANIIPSQIPVAPILGVERKQRCYYTDAEHG